MGLITTAEAKTHLGVTVSTYDTEIAAFVEAATEAMERAAGRHLVSTAVTEVLDGTGGRYLWLAEPPESITSIKISASQDWSTTTAESSDDYTINGSAVDRLSQVWTQGEQNIQVIYSAGFATVPDDLAVACKMFVGILYAEWQRTKAGLDNVASHNVGGWSQTFITSTGLPPFVETVCKRYQPERL